MSTGIGSSPARPGNAAGWLRSNRAGSWYRSLCIPFPRPFDDLRVRGHAGSRPDRFPGTGYPGGHLPVVVPGLDGHTRRHLHLHGDGTPLRVDPGKAFGAGGADSNWSRGPGGGVADGGSSPLDGTRSSQSIDTGPVGPRCGGAESRDPSDPTHRGLDAEPVSLVRVPDAQRPPCHPESSPAGATDRAPVTACALVADRLALHPITRGIVRNIDRRRVRLVLTPSDHEVTSSLVAGHDGNRIPSREQP